MNYSIEIRYHGQNTGRFITSAIKGWMYETSPFSMPLFTKDEALAIIERVKEQYVYSVLLHGEDGSKELISCIPWDKPKTIAKPQTIKIGIKMGGLKIKLRK